MADGPDKKPRTPPAEFRDPSWPPGLYRRGKFYHYRRRIDGVRRSQPLRTRTLNVAITMAHKYNERLEDQKVPIDAVLAETKVSFSEVAADYMKSRNLRPRSLKAYKAILANFARVAGSLIGRPEPLLRDVTADLVSRFVTARRHEPTARNGHKNTRKSLAGASAKTVAEEVNLISSVMRSAVERKLIQVAPNLTMMQRELASRGIERDVARPLSTDEARRLLAAAKQFDADEPKGFWPYADYFFSLLSTFLYTGLRHDEMRHLRWADVDLIEDLMHIRFKKLDIRRTIAVKPAARAILEGLVSGRQAADKVCRNDTDIQRLGRALNFREPDTLAMLAVRQVDMAAGVVRIEEHVEWQPKGVEGKVLIHPELKKLLVSMKESATSDFVFPHPDGGPWRFHLNDKLHEIADMAKLTEKPRVHDLRHTVGATLRRAAVGLETIKEVLRHSCLEETLRYAKYEINEGRTAIQKLPTWAG